jgi:sugar phosphate isomerase/epimerase
MDIFNKSGELCKKFGMKFGYHNHSFEFNTHLDGQSIYGLILQNTDPSLVIQQMDIGNMYEAGGRALDLLEQYPGRFASMHVKDEIKSGRSGEHDRYESAILGVGVVEVKKVIDLARKSGGTTDFIIEQESYQDKTPLACAKEDLDMMKKWGY